MDYLRLARALDRIASTPSRREKVTVAADLLTSAPGHVLADVARLLVGQVLAPWRGESMGANVQTVGEALCEAGGYSPERLARTMEETRELGLAAERLNAHRLQSTLAPAPQQARPTG